MKGLTLRGAAHFFVSRYSVRTYGKLDHKQQIFAKITATTYINSVPTRVQIMQTFLSLMFVLSCRIGLGAAQYTQSTTFFRE